MIKRKIPYIDFRRLNAPYRNDFHHQVDEILESGWILMGEKTKCLEDKLSAMHDNRFSLGVSNGLDALRLIFRGYLELGALRKGDKIIVPSNTYIASLLPIIEFGLVPVLVEPDRKTLNINWDLLDDELVADCKAIVLVHLYGRICYSDRLNDLKKLGIIIIEDNAQAIGARIFNDDGKICHTGALGDAAGFSFYPGKNIGAIGDAGAIVCKDENLYDVIKALRNYGSERKYYNKYRGYNCRISEVNAAFTSLKLANMEIIVDRRRFIARKYLRDINNPLIELPSFDFERENEESHVWHIFHLLVKDGRRDDFQKYLGDMGVGTVIHYPIPMHKQVALQKELSHFDLPLTELLHNSIISIPLNETMLDEEINYVVHVVNSWK